MAHSDGTIESPQEFDVVGYYAEYYYPRSTGAIEFEAMFEKDARTQKDLLIRIVPASGTSRDVSLSPVATVSIKKSDAVSTTAVKIYDPDQRFDGLAFRPADSGYRPLPDYPYVPAGDPGSDSLVTSSSPTRDGATTPCSA